MEKNNISMELRMKIREYLRYTWTEEKTQGDDEEVKILNALPSHLRKEFLISSYGTILNHNPLFFQNFSKRTLNETVFRGLLKQIRLAPGDIVFEVPIKKSEREVYSSYLMKRRMTFLKTREFTSLLKEKLRYFIRNRSEAARKRHFRSSR